MLFHKHKRALLGGDAFGHFTAPTDPMIMSVEGDPASTGDPAPAAPAVPAVGDPAATFTQEDMNRVLASDRRANEQKNAGLQASADKVAGLEASLREMKDAKELADASTAEQATILAQRSADQHQAKIDELTGKITALEADSATSATEMSRFKTQTVLSQELAKAGMLGAAAKHAVPAMMSEIEVTLSDTGSISTIKLGGVMQTDVPAAVGQFLTDNPHFKAASSGGSGTPQPTPGSGLRADKPLHEQPDSALWAESRKR